MPGWIPDGSGVFGYATSGGVVAIGLGLVDVQGMGRLGGEGRNEGMND